MGRVVSGEEAAVVVVSARMEEVGVEAPAEGQRRRARSRILT